MTHEHHHHDNISAPKTREELGRYALGFSIGLGVFLLQAWGSFETNSLALWADSGHVAVDLLAYGIAAFAGWKASTSAHPERVRRNWMIWSVVLLLVFLGWNLAEAWDRWRNPAATAGLGTFIIALAGAVGNLIQHRIVIAGEDNHTTRGLALHTLEDLISSVAVMASGVLVAFTEQSAWDPIATGIVCLWLAYRAGCRLIDSGHHHH